MKFSLLHPSRSRSTKSFDTVQKWIQNASGTDFEVIISIDSNDPYMEQYHAIYSNVAKANIIVNDNRSAVDAINNAAKESSGEVLIVVSDDTGCISNWDGVISNAVAGKSDYVLKVYDGIQKWIVTMPVMDRTYYNRFGYVYYPEFKHMFCDTFLTHQADALKRIIWRNDITIPHLHYSIKKSVKDEVSERADKTLHDGQDVYFRLIRKNLLLDNRVDIWNLSEHADSHMKWIRTKTI
jgi:glycosyltransferase involved in cell wall biosynthesis